MEATATQSRKAVALDTDELHLEVSDDGIATVWLDQPGEAVNTLARSTLEAFDEAVDAIEDAPAIRASVFISAKPSGFVAGADLDALRNFETPEDVEAFTRTGHRTIRRVRSSPKPSVAAIHGPALGGGLEVALACDYRVATDTPATRMQLPEVQLGLLPGGNGTQLLPRLVGLQRALPMLLTGKTAYAGPARKMGLVDALIHRPGLHRAAQEAARRLADGSLTPDRSARGFTDKVIESNTLTRRFVYRQARKQIKSETRGNYPAPPRILECVRTGLEDGFDAGAEAEARHFAELVFTPESRALVSLFFSKQKRDDNPLDGQQRDVDTVVVLGAGGLMGAGIAEVSAHSAGHEVLLKDQSLGVAAKGRKTIWNDLSKKIGKGVTEFERDVVMERARAVGGYDDLAGTDLVIEAVPEDLDIKHDVLRETEQAVPSDCVIASNTSGIPITDIAAGLERPANVVGMHYFSPVPSMPLLEVVRGKDSSDGAVATAIQAGLDQGKTVITVEDGPGFYTTRILSLYMNEALLLLEEGADVKQVDAIMEDFGFPMGPYELFDLVGIQTAAKITDVMGGYIADGRLGEGREATLSGAASTLAQAGLAGQSGGEGFYEYDGRGADSSKDGVNDEVYAFFGGADRDELARQVVEERLSMMMCAEAVRCLEEGILHSAADGDLGVVFGLGFPPFRGGPFRHLDRMGLENAVTRLKRLESRHGPRFAVPALLEENAENGHAFREK
jgi:3-hydroxyacyl-CoA dehydrogenase/enoyl-CoA hydratase/3-hydroxybutyryl-CoA epimerase